jgi:hypothetical protein
MSARRTAPNWSLERSVIKADRAKSAVLGLNWVRSQNDRGELCWKGREPEYGGLVAYVAKFDDTFFAYAFPTGSLECVSVGEVSARGGALALRKAQALGEAFIAAQSAPAQQAA